MSHQKMTRPEMFHPEMNSRHKVLFAALWIFLAIPCAWAGEYSHARVVRLSLAEGDVQVMNAGENNWQKAIVNLPVREGMTIATGQGRAEIEFESGTTTRLADNSVVQFTELALADGDKVTRLDLSQGTATVYMDRSRHDTFEVHSGKLLIAARENSRFRVDVFQDGASVSVLKGNVEVETAGSAERVSKGQTLALRDDAPDQIVLQRNPAPDAWDRWVSQRDDSVGDGVLSAQRYVSSPVSYGLADLSYYGGWYNYSGFGNCWRPYGAGFGWSPFYNGSWAFVPGFGLTWVSFEPWGWMPYHYGSWFFSPVYGWLWVPGYFNAWNPGRVYWYRTPGVVGWVPRSPKDKPGVTPQNLPHGVITNTATGLGTGLPHQRGVLTAGESPRFFTDTRGEGEMQGLVQDIKTAQLRTQTSPDHSGTVGELTAASAKWTPGPARKMSDRETGSAPVHVYTIVPAAPGSSVASAHGGSAHAAGSFSGSRAGGSSSSSRPAHSSPSSHSSSSSPAPHSSPSSRPPSSGRSHP